ncbi:GNAT family N-acetyltransferase [Salinispora mooreana]|uniref:GNAT family N-acetyltransferase n=1 Tax=Salinispora mooreana TaxID=999545 RepID=UPI00037FF865|nr:GNAT family N-acetyltransferase [Salinispora mooreana]
MDDLSIRDRVPADLQRCISVLADVHRLDRYPLNWPADTYQWLSPDNTRHAWIAERGSTLVGHVAIHHPASAADPAFTTNPVAATSPAATTVVEISRLFVAPAARRHNTATRLLHHARQWATEHQLDLMLEIVDDPRSAAAIALYEHTGWRHTHTTTADWTSPEGRPVRLRRYILRGHRTRASWPPGDPLLNENVARPIGR